MRKLVLTLMLAIAAAVAGAEAHSIYDFTIKSIDGEQVSLKSYHRKVVLLVNVAVRGPRSGLREVQGSGPGDRRHSCE